MSAPGALDMADGPARKPSRELAEQLFAYARLCPPGRCISTGGILGGALVQLVKAQGKPADLAWLIQILTDCAGLLAAHLQEED